MKKSKLKFFKTFHFSLASLRLRSGLFTFDLNSGQSLIELLIAMGLVALLLPAILTGLVASREGKAQEDRRLQARALLREAEEVTRSVREKGWKYVATQGIYHPGSEYKISICSNSGCPPELSSYTGQADANGSLIATFSPTPNAAAFEIWIRRPSTSPCTGLECFSTGFINSLSLSGLTDGINYTVQVCSQANCVGGQVYSQFTGQSTGGVLNAIFTYAPSFTGAAIYEVWVRQPPAPGCSGIACFGFTLANTNSSTISGLDSSKVWSLASGAETINGLTRQIEISNVERDSAGNIVTSGGTLDPSTKKVGSTVSWTTPVASKVESTMYLSRYLGNTSWQQTTFGHFNAGAHDGTLTVPIGGGAVQIDTSVGGNIQFGNRFIVDSVSSIVEMSNFRTATDLRFTAKNNKTVDKIRIYIHDEEGISPTYRYGIKNDVGGSPAIPYISSSTYQATTPGWHTIDIPDTTINVGTIYHIFIEHASGTVNANHNVKIRASSPLNLLYPFDNSQDPNAQSAIFIKTPFNFYAPQNKQPIYALEFTDSSFEGNPYEAGDESPAYGFVVHGEQFTVPNPTTVKAVYWQVRKNSASVPADDLIVTLQDITNSLAIDSGIIVNRNSVTQTYRYYSYNFASPVTFNPGTTYRITAGSPFSSRTNTYMVKRVNNATAQTLNSINYDGTNSTYFVTVFGSVNYWDAAGWHMTNNVAQFTSQLFDAGSQVAFNNITWGETTPLGTDIQLQVSIDSSPFFGPSGTGSFYNSPGAIPLDLTLGQTVQFRATLTGNGATTPRLLDIDINYSP